MTKHKTLALAAAGCLMISVTGCGQKSNKEIRVYTSLLGAVATTISPDNEIQQIIAEKTGAKCIETWISGQDEQDALFGDMMMNGQYPDFVYPNAANCQKLIKAGALIPIDSYWEQYPNLKNYFDDAEWDRIRAEDGHVYYIPAFSNCYMQDTATSHNDEAFWIQLKVLKWAGYPEIRTLDDYFDLIERYLDANPTDENGEPYIGHEILANDSFFFGLDNPPMFLDGYPNDGCCIVNPDTLEAVDYNLSPTAKKWFAKLNEEYHKGVIDREFSLLTSEEYYERIATGRVLGTVDQYWNFNSAIGDLPVESTYIPLGPTISADIEERYHSRTAFDGSSGIGVTVSCDDPEGALQFINDLLDPEILNLRFWGVEDVDYMVGEDGVFYQTDEQAARWNSPDYANTHICVYSYFPFYWGMNQDGINAYCTANQAREFYKSLPDEIKECFDAYGVRTYVELLNDAPENAPWYPMWSYQNAMSESADAYNVMSQIEAAKHQYLPRLVMQEDFEAAWAEYEAAYEKINPQVYFDVLTEEVRRLAQT